MVKIKMNYKASTAYISDLIYRLLTRLLFLQRFASYSEIVRYAIDWFYDEYYSYDKTILEENRQ